MRKHISKILATSEPLGYLEEVERLAKKVADTQAEAIVVLGSLTSKSATTRAYGKLFKILAETRLPTFYIPGSEDVPMYEYLREAANSEVVCPSLRGVHGTFAFAPGYIVFTGIGGTVIDDPHMIRGEQALVKAGKQKGKGKLLLKPALVAAVLDPNVAPSFGQRYGLEQLLLKQVHLREERYRVFRQHWYQLQARDFRHEILDILNA